MVRLLHSDPATRQRRVAEFSAIFVYNTVSIPVIHDSISEISALRYHCYKATGHSQQHAHKCIY